MFTFETVNELTLKVTCQGAGTIFTKVGAFIGGTNQGGKNYKFEKVLLGPQQNIGQALLGQVARRVTGENLPLMRAVMSGPSETFYASYGQHVIVYRLGMGEMISVESENILAFTSDCNYSVKFLGVGVVSQKGVVTSSLTGNGPEAYVAILSNGNPIILDNIKSGMTIAVDPDAVVCWVGSGYNCDPAIRTDLSWRNLLGQNSGESYYYEWPGSEPVSVLVQPSERMGGISVSVD